MNLRNYKFIFNLFAIMVVAGGFAQEEIKSLKKANNLIYEANELVDEDFITAEKEYRKAISKLPGHNAGSYNLANALYDSGYYEEAVIKHIEAANNATSKEERHKAFHNIGNALMQQRQCQEAVEAFKNALRNDPSDDESRYNLALAKECAKQQGKGEGDDENQDEENKEDKEDQNENSEDQQEQNQDEQDNNEGNDDQNQNEGEDNEDENGKPKDEKSNNPQDESEKKRQPQPGKLSPQQVKNLLEAMHNQEKKVQEKINARKVKGAKVKTEKDW